MSCPGTRADVHVEVPHQSPELPSGAARALTVILRAATTARSDRPEIDHSGEEPEAIAS
jgi:hypothetical protein